MHDVETVYSVPLLLHSQKVDKTILKKLKINTKQAQLNDWKRVVKAKLLPEKEVTVSFVGKYTELKDSYKSINEALEHAGIQNKAKVNINFVEAEQITSKNVRRVLKKSDAILVPGGFGERGIEGMILACKYARENNVPYLGICLGMQIAIIEYARNVKKIRYANSTEISEKCKDPVIDLMTSQKEIINKGGTMRLGAWDCEIEKNTKSYKCYKKKLISERHRHRYEFNNNYTDRIFDDKFVIAGSNPDTKLVEIVENIDHPWFVGVQFHPEYQSTVKNPHPLFVSFVEACKKTI